MKKYLLFIAVLLISFRANAQTKLVNVIFLNDSLDIQSYQLKRTDMNETEILNFMLQKEKNVDMLQDSIYFSLEQHHYCIYVPQRHIKFTVNALHEEKVNEHFLWLLKTIRANLNNIVLLTSKT